ncbi:MAG: asparaginase domain-containing protein, partial [Symbiobacteriaceae bacterium]
MTRSSHTGGTRAREDRPGEEKPNPKPWGGRFTAATDRAVEAFTASIDVDARLLDVDIRASQAHARMLGARGILSREEAETLIAGLDEVRRRLQTGEFRLDPALEDVHMNVEHLLARVVGPVAGKLHTGRSRNDQVATDMHLYLRRRVTELWEIADLELEIFANVDSSDIDPSLWQGLARRIHERIGDCDGVVVTHGTDTMAYTASALSFMLQNLPKPVVLTGSQRPLGEIRTDARLNLIDAVIAATRGEDFPEVAICFDSKIFRGNRARKVKIAEYDAFDSPNVPPLGGLGVEVVIPPIERKGGAFRLLDRLDRRAVDRVAAGDRDRRVVAAADARRGDDPHLVAEARPELLQER